MHFGASYSSSNKLLLVVRHILNTGLQNVFKVGSIKFANSLLLPSIVKEYTLEVKAASGHKRCWAKVKGVNNPNWTTQYIGLLITACDYMWFKIKDNPRQRVINIMLLCFAGYMVQTTLTTLSSSSIMFITTHVHHHLCSSQRWAASVHQCDQWTVPCWNLLTVVFSSLTAGAVLSNNSDSHSPATRQSILWRMNQNYV